MVAVREMREVKSCSFNCRMGNSAVMSVISYGKDPPILYLSAFHSPSALKHDNKYSNIRCSELVEQ